MESGSVCFMDGASHSRLPAPLVAQHPASALRQQLHALPAAFCCAHEGSQQDERVVIHSISGNVDMCPRCRRDAFERKVNTLLPRLLPLARRLVFFGSCRLRIGHVLASYSRLAAKAKTPFDGDANFSTSTTQARLFSAGSPGLDASRLQIHRTFPNIGMLLLQFIETVHFCLQARLEHKPSKARFQCPIGQTLQEVQILRRDFILGGGVLK